MEAISETGSTYWVCRSEVGWAKKEERMVLQQLWQKRSRTVSSLHGVKDVSLDETEWRDVPVIAAPG